MPNPTATNRAVFLDRDGVLIQDVALLTQPSQIQILPGVPQALQRLAAADFQLIVVTNQTVVARGMATESEVAQINALISQQLCQLGTPPINKFYVCPHHPQATLSRYQVDCQCRKPRPGMLLRAAQDFHLDLTASFLVGDRITDIIAGARAGCRTILVQTGRHLDAPIKTSEPLNPSIRPDFTCAGLPAASAWILNCQ